MTFPSFPILRTGMLLAAAMVASTGVQAGDWRQAHVRAISARSDVDPAVDVECAPLRPDQPGHKVLVVSYRVGKSLQWRAFDLAADDAYGVGDEVIINIAGCLVARQPQPADVAASAP
jgi:hypothetical protein